MSRVAVKLHGVIGRAEKAVDDVEAGRPTRRTGSARPSPGRTGLVAIRGCLHLLASLLGRTQLCCLNWNVPGVALYAIFGGRRRAAEAVIDKNQVARM